MRPPARATVAVLAVIVVAGCAPGIANINARPSRYYQQTVKLTGQITRTQLLPGETLLEIQDARARRMLVHTREPVSQNVGDWVRVKGLFVPEAKVGGRVVYDVVAADEIESTRAPWLRNLM